MNSASIRSELSVNISALPTRRFKPKNTIISDFHSLSAEKTPFIPKFICKFATDMSSKECIRHFSPNLFWDANPSELKMDESRDARRKAV